MMQQINLLQNNRSVFRTAVAFIVPKSGPIHLVLVGLTAGRPADKSLVVLKVITCVFGYLNRFLDYFTLYQ